MPGRTIARTTARTLAAAAVTMAMMSACTRDVETAPTLSSATSAPTTVADSTTTTTSTTSTTSTSTTTSTTVPATTTTTAPPASTTTTPPPPTTTSLPPGGCGPLGLLPAGAIETGTALVDVDLDGANDVVRTYTTSPSPVAGDWHLRVELAAGGGADLTLPFDPAPAGVEVLGGAYIGSTADPGPGGPRPAIFITVGAGASATIVGLYRLVGCDLVPMTGGEFGVGGGVMHTEHIRCDGVAGTSLLVYVTTQYDDAAGTHEITETPFTRTGNGLVPYVAPLVSTVAVLPVWDLIENCGNVSL